jgi:hypothetical protein
MDHEILLLKYKAYLAAYVATSPTGVKKEK